MTEQPIVDAATARAARRSMVELFICQLMTVSQERFEREYSNVRAAALLLAEMDEQEAERARAN